MAINNEVKKYIGDVLEEAFNDYNESAPLKCTFDDKNDARKDTTINKIKSNNNEKIASAKRIVALAAGLVNQKLQDADANIELINVTDTFSLNSQDARISTKIKLNDQDKVVDVYVNFNARKMLNLPPQEFYSVVCALLYNSILAKSISDIGGLNTLKKQSENGQSVDFLRPQYDDPNVVRKKGSNAVDTETIDTIKTYLSNFLSQYMDEKNSASYDDIAELVAEEMLTTDRSAESILKSMFDVSKIKEFEDNSLNEARNSRLVDNVELAMNEYDMLGALTYEQQAAELLSTRTKSTFNAMKNSKEQVQNLANFCISFVDDFLRSNGLVNSGVMLTFNRTGTPGNFVKDNNGTRTINIDLSAVKSVTDLVMTMSHEVTHCLDSFKPGNENGANGLADSMEYDDIKSLGLKRGSKESKFLRKIHSYCYHLDPAERRARQGELAGLKFMQALAVNDPSLKEDISVNIKKFERYQNRVIKDVATLTGPNAAHLYAELQKEYIDMKGSLSPEVDKAMTTRLDYLKKLMGEGILSATQEMQSVKTSRNIRNEMNGLPKESSNDQRGL